MTVDVPADHKAMYDKYRERLIESVAEIDDALMQKFMDGHIPTPDEMRAALRKATCRGQAPSGRLRLGVQEQGRPAAPRRGRRRTCRRRSTSPPSRRRRGRQGRRSRHEGRSAVRGPRLQDHDGPFVGQLAFFRVYAGHLDAGSGVYNSTKQTNERIGRLLKMHANKREEIKEVWAGDIARGRRPQERHDGRHDLRPRPHRRPRVDEVPRARHHARRSSRRRRPTRKRWAWRSRSSCRKTPRSASTRTRRRTRRSSPGWASSISRSSSTAWCASSTSVRTSASPRSRTARRSARTSRARASSSASRAARASTATPRSACGRIPRARTTSSSMRSSGGSIPKEFIKPIDQGIREAILTGVLAGYPTVNIQVELYDGSYPRRRLLGNGLQDRRLHGVPGRRQEGEPGHSRADDGRRGRHARRVPRAT